MTKPRVKRYPPLEVRFWQKVDIGGLDDCWGWVGCLNKAGYGSFRVDNKTCIAHRVSYCLANNLDIRDLLWDTVVMHSCDMPSCCNPRHLSAGTQLENVADMISKGRRYDFSGENNPACVLPNDDAVRLLRVWRSGGRTLTSLAQEFGIGRSTVQRIVTGYRKVIEPKRITRTPLPKE